MALRWKKGYFLTTQRDKQKETERGREVKCEGVEVKMNVHVTPSFDSFVRRERERKRESERKGSVRPCCLPSKNSDREGPPPPALHIWLFTAALVGYGTANGRVHSDAEISLFAGSQKNIAPSPPPHSTRGSLHSSLLGSRGSSFFWQNRMLLHTSTQC